MSQSEKENLNPKDPEQVQDTMSDEEFEKKQARSSERSCSKVLPVIFHKAITASQ